MPYVQLSHKMFVICINNRQNQIFSEMSLRDVMELPTNLHSSLISANIFGIKNSIKICHVSHNVLRHMSHTGVSPGNICINYI